MFASDDARQLGSWGSIRLRILPAVLTGGVSAFANRRRLDRQAAKELRHLRELRSQ